MADILQSAQNANTGFMIYSAMLSLGSCVGYLLSAVDWQTIVEPEILSSEQTAIVIVLILFSITLLITMITAHERPSIKIMSNGGLACNGDLENNATFGDVSDTERLLTGSRPAMTIGPICSTVTLKKILKNSFRISFLIACLIKAVTSCIVAIFKPFRNVYEAPIVLQRLFWADLLCWMALMAHSMFCTDYVATVVYGGNAYAERGSVEDLRFDEGVRMGSVGLLLHSTTGMFYSKKLIHYLLNILNNFSMSILKFCPRQHVQHGWSESDLHLRIVYFWPFHVVHSLVPFCGGLEYLCSLFWSGLCCGHNHSLYFNYQIS